MSDADETNIETDLDDPIYSDDDPDWEWKKKTIQELEFARGPLSREELDRIMSIGENHEHN